MAFIFFLLLEGMVAQPFHSRHFAITKLSDGIYAALESNGGEAICNAGIIDLGDATLIFDPFMSLDPARELAKLAKQLTRHPVKYVINSHFHNDHIGGDQVFPQALLISTGRTRELIAKYQPQEIEDDKKSAPAALAELRKQNLHGLTKHEMDEHQMWTGYYQALVRSSDSLRTVLPQLTFDRQLTIHGSRRIVQIISYGEGHTESDAFLFLPAERIAFMGDLLFIQNQPWLGDGNPELWANYLDSVKRLNPSILIPGHGPAGTIRSLDTMKLYFEEVNRRAREYIGKGIIPAKDSTLRSPAPYDQWFLSNFYRPNVQSEYERISKK
jgi:glyoxylase-like metal-dependent hydrolase (beta-lactamase superfamily II)